MEDTNRGDERSEMPTLVFCAATPFPAARRSPLSPPPEPHVGSGQKVVQFIGLDASGKWLPSAAFLQRQT
jgi:hypothetical protein